MEDTCIICLDPPLPNSPLLLLACGCKISWFHRPCELRWLSTCQSPISCPVCKRIVPLDTNYCFHPKAGPVQSIFWNVILFTPFEFLIWNILPVQTVLFICIPFMIKSEQSLEFFICHAYIKQLLVFSTYFIDLRLFPVILFCTCFHVFVVFLIQVNSYITIDFIPRNPLAPFAISRQIRHAAITYPVAEPNGQVASDE